MAAFAPSSTKFHGPVSKRYIPPAVGQPDCTTPARRASQLQLSVSRVGVGQCEVNGTEVLAHRDSWSISLLAQQLCLTTAKKIAACRVA